MHSLCLETHSYSCFDFRQKDRVEIRIDSTTVKGRIIHGNNPKELIKEYTNYCGRMSILPEWTQNGIILGIQGGEQRVYSLIQESIQYKVPLSGVWLQDWCGSRDQRILGHVLKRLWWNWENDTLLYPNWNEFVHTLTQRNIAVLSYVNPFLMDVEMGEKPTFKRNLYKEAKKKGFLVTNNSKDIFKLCSGPQIEAGVIDLFNPKAVEWLELEFIHHFKSGIKGYMADFGECLPPGCFTHVGVCESSHHNEYVEQWAQLQKNVLKKVSHDSHLQDNVQENLQEYIIFHRSGFTKSPGIGNCFWTGDQLVSWDTFDGIKAGLTGLLSSGMSGFSLNHMDVGGYSTFGFVLFGYKFGYYRSQELLFRWMELGVFGCIYRSHQGSMPNVNAQVYSNSISWNHLAHCGSMYTCLKQYRLELMMEAQEYGYPLIRTMFFEFPFDLNVRSLSHQFMFGESILVCPVLDPYTSVVKVYLPEIQDKWMHAWTGKSYSHGWNEISAPIGQPGIFIKQCDYNEKESLKELIHYCRQNSTLNPVEIPFLSFQTVFFILYWLNHYIHLVLQFLSSKYMNF